MAKSFFYRLFGFGKIPASQMSEFNLEGIVWFDEGIKGSVTYLDFHRPGKSSNWERRWLNTSIVLTKLRLIALNEASFLIDVSLNDERLNKMNFSLENGETLLIGFDAGLFQPEWTGTIEYRFKTELAQNFLDAISKEIFENKKQV